MPVIVAIDLSIADTGVAYGGTAGPASSFASIQSSPVNTKLKRWEVVIDGIGSYLYGKSPITIWMEQGVSYADRGRTNNDNAELRGAVRWHMFTEFSITEVVEVPPDCIKKFATGDGFASKEMMVAAVESWGYSLPTIAPGGKKKNHNVADAVALFEFARAACYGQKTQGDNAYAAHWYRTH